ncbi:MAG: hypothetical protein Q8O40_00350 [Chloroflexota bacterium]|nr:hypothetical protein [Chloroflexota bacterium]
MANGRGKPTPLEVSSRWAGEHRQGESFTAIASRAGVGRKTVARAVTRYEGGAALEEAAGARRLLAADYLRAHLAWLEVAARFLLQTIAPASLTGKPKLRLSLAEIGRLVVARLETWHVEDVIGYRTKLPFPDTRSFIDLNQPAHARRLDERMARLHAQTMWDALNEHVPALAATLYRLNLAESDAETEKRFAQLEELLSPARLQKQLITTHCRHCPVP